MTNTPTKQNNELPIDEIISNAFIEFSKNKMWTPQHKLFFSELFRDMTVIAEEYRKKILLDCVDRLDKHFHFLKKQQEKNSDLKSEFAKYEQKIEGVRQSINLIENMI